MPCAHRTQGMARAHDAHIRGISLVEMILAISIILIVFMGLFAAFQAMLLFGERNKLHANALMLANEHIELIRALPFDSIGTVGGLPSGSIPQIETVTYDGRQYTRRTFIQYVDDPADGLDVADTLPADYKRVKVEFTYTYSGATRSVSMVTTVAPKSQESLDGAGVLRINVADADNDPVSLAEVHVLNTAIATTVDVTTFTNPSGVVSLPGAWAGGGYEVTVTKPGYSTAGTYNASSTNDNPSPGQQVVTENSTLDLIFKIDRLSTLSLMTRAWPTRDRLLEQFDDTTQLSGTFQTTVSGSSLALVGAPGSYPAFGSSTSIVTAPASLDRWLMLSFVDSHGVSTDVRYFLEFDAGGGMYERIPDGDLPGNAAGFTDSPIGLAELSTSTYQSLRVVAELTSGDPMETPDIDGYTLSYLQPAPALSAVPFTLRTTTKTIGTTDLGDPVYKYNGTHATDAAGYWEHTALEWDTYELVPTGYTVAEACPRLPLVLEPDTVMDQTLILASPSTNTLHVHVAGPLGDALPYAEVRVVGGTTDMTRATGPCGGAFFSSLQATTHTVTILAPGYQATSTSVVVNGATSHIMELEI